MSLPTYEAITSKLGIPRCRGILPNGQRCFLATHDSHHGSYSGGYVHWGDRAPTRSGIREYLTLAALRYLDQGEEQEALWRLHYRAQLLVGEWQRMIGVRFPPKISDKYRARLKVMLVDVPTSEPMRAEAMRWATRS